MTVCASWRTHTLGLQGRIAWREPFPLHATSCHLPRPNRTTPLSPPRPPPVRPCSRPLSHRQILPARPLTSPLARRSEYPGQISDPYRDSHSLNLIVFRSATSALPSLLHPGSNPSSLILFTSLTLTLSLIFSPSQRPPSLHLCFCFVFNQLIFTCCVGVRDS